MYSLNTDSAPEPSRTASHITVTIICLLQTFILILLFMLSLLVEEHSSAGAHGFRREEKKSVFFFFGKNSLFLLFLPVITHLKRCCFV